MTKESGRSPYKIYVGNLSPHTSDNDLVRVFGHYGTVIEAVALSAKGYGFVHMSSEDEGVRAMKSLYKHMLHGKEMVVQPAINPKKASSTSQYSNNRRATIGKGVSTLDDFDEFQDIDKYLSDSINHCIESADNATQADSSATSTQSYLPYCTATNEVVHNSRGNTSAISGGIVNLDNSANSSVGGLVNNSYTNNIVASSASTLLPNSQPNSNVNITVPRQSSVWENSPVAVSSNNNTVLNFAQNTNASQSSSFYNHSKPEDTLKPEVKDVLLRNGILLENFQKNIGGQVNATPIGQQQQQLGSSAFLSKLCIFQGNQIREIQAAIQQNPNNIQLLALYEKVQQELGQSQVQLHLYETSQQQPKDDIESSILKLKRQQLQEQEVQKQFLLQRQLQQQQQLHHQQQLLPNANNSAAPMNNANNLLPGFTAVAAAQANVSLPSVISNANNTSTPMFNFNNINNPMPSVGMNPRNSLPTNTSSIIESNSVSASNSVMSKMSHNLALSATNKLNNNLLCGLCNKAYDNSSMLPKILGCTHTFCLRCLVNATDNMELQCPGGCGLITQLPTAGPADLTTNQGILSAVQQNGQLAADDQSSLPAINLGMSAGTEVCAQCTGTSQEQPMIVCREQGHTIVQQQEAMHIVVTQLRPLVQKTLDVLKQVMTLRASIKERVENTLESLSKFTEELKKKLQHDNIEEELLYSTLNDLNSVHNQMDRHSYKDLVRTYHMVEKCGLDISRQYNQCMASACVNDALTAMTVQLNSGSLPIISKMGIHQNELFDMNQKLQDHARAGNFANVLLHYMVCDLLISRLNPAVATGVESFFKGTENGTQSGSIDNLSSIQESRSACSMSPIVGATDITSSAYNDGMTNGSFKSLSASSSATPDMTAMNGHNLDSLSNNIDTMDINDVIQTTEAIEAENRASSNPDPGQFTENSMAFGLRNICAEVEEPPVETIYLESSLLEGSASIDPEPIKVQCSAPSPTSSNSITPPIVSAARASVDSSAASSDSGISTKPFSYLDAAKKPAKPQPELPKSEVSKLPAQIKQMKTPHCWMKLTVDGDAIGRIVFQLRPDKAPKMCENFLGLCLGKPGYGYEGTHFFKNGDGFLAGGDVEFDDGSGGYSIFGKKKFEADLCPLKDEVGMIRFKGNGTSDAGRGMVGSQFMVWYAEREFKKFSYSLVFGRVVDGMDVVKKAANVNLANHDVMIAECGGIT